MTKDLRAYWNGELECWVIDTPIGLASWEIERCRNHLLKIQTDRYLSLQHGDKREECLKTISALNLGRIQQNIVGVGDKVLFDAWKSELSNKKIFHP